MSQPMHSHGPGQPMHSHGPPAPPGQPTMQQGPPQQPPPPDPVIQAAIDASFRRVDFILGPPNNSVVLCQPHSLEKCADCEVDFTGVNALAKILATGSDPQAVPPPPQMATNQRAQLVAKTKEDGNTHYKNNRFKEAVQSYQIATNISLSRPSWEPSATTREEVAVNLSNRSAAYLAMADYMSSLVDSILVIGLKRNWTKGYLRKGKALLGLGKHRDAKLAVGAGLAFEPENAELLGLSSDIDAAVAKAQKAAAPKLTSPSTDSLLI